jgi:hypothetical protein
MILFSRQTVLTGSPTKVGGAAIAVTEHINTLIDSDLRLWSGGPGFPVGAFAWTAQFDSHADLGEQMARFATDATADSLVDVVRSMSVGPPEDSIRRLIHGDPDAPAPPVGTVVTATTATIALENLTEAMAWGVEMAVLVSDITGSPTSFYQELYGTFGQVTWISANADMAGVDAAQDAIAGNEEYVEGIRAGATLFIPGSGSQGIATRIA